jgi:hypothetical protein
MSDELSTITFRLPTSLREKIKTQASAEERSEGAFIRFHIGQMLAVSEDETEVNEEELTSAEP